MSNNFLRRSSQSNKFNQPDTTRINTTQYTSTGQDFVHGGIDLSEQLIPNKATTFYFKMNGQAMEGAGINSGDILIVDRSITTVNGKVIVAVLNGEMMVRRLEKTINKIRLIPETAKLATIEVDPYAEFAVWGVVTYVVHAL